MTKPPPRTEAELVELVRSSDLRAPDSLHRQVEALLAAHREGGRGLGLRRRLAARAALPRPRFSPLGSIAVTMAVVAVVAVALAAGLGRGGGPTTLSMRQAAAPTLRAATLPAPSESSMHHAQLAAAVDGVPFPYWEDRFGWRSTGARTDRVNGRSVTTVFYADSSGRRIGYAILAGTPAPRIGGGAIAWRDGVPYRLLTEYGAPAVTWVRDGHLCVVSGRGVSNATLLRLASWSEHDATPA
ncbi:MAG TPA: hypothetical protein VGL54_06455 [Solirubrobacteraceae bacterium]|jgi:hypothetical protein